MNRPSVSKIQQVFFLAMLRGYAKSPAKAMLPQLPGSRVVTTVHGYGGRFRVADCWLVSNNSNLSSGTTTIWFKNEPVWVMHYGGWYDMEVIPFLKKCLLRAYRKREFYGGRGPVLVRGKDYVYENQVTDRRFEVARGEESICDLAHSK
jgi:hypothetical protein